MIAPPKPDLVTVNIDGKDIAVPKGTNVIEAARQLGIEIPHYCYHPKLTVAGNCRMCLIEMGMPAVDPATKAPIMDPATGKPKINWIPRPQIGCATNASPGLHVKTNSPMARESREGVTEFLLINHPLDCPICDQAGECKLQEHSTAYGRGYSRFVEQKNVKPKRTQLGPRVTLDDERCILCSRCVRFSKEVAKDDVLGFVDRGSYSTLTCYPGKQLANNYSLNTVDICPVGALTSTDFRFKMRVWFLKQTPSIDPESSVGANTEVWSREGVIYRITPRQNDAVNDTWMADSGRVLYKQVKADNRLLAPTINGAATAAQMAIKAAADLLHAGSVAIVGSGRSSVEEQFLTKKLADALKVSASLVSRVGAGDKILVSADRNPNVRGALVTGLIAALPTAQLTLLAAGIDAGQVKTVLSLGEDLTGAGLNAAQLAKVSVIYLGTHKNATSDAAKVVIPTLTIFEKSGTFVNQQFRLQKFAQAVPGPAGVADDLVTLAALVGASNRTTVASDLGSLWTTIAAEVKPLAAVTYASLSATGLLLDATPWAALPFVEGETLHFKPAAVPAAVNA
ncbi:2Fe-2S iron-sulfur cluster-binding protein [Opitutus sp. GAS368]|jgi:NADH-quinone oxidoreductase subunit G|uniref:2Fe-2S iron-sulfur cluster-binding protein n=1 Tax=Opitutus sp. GAS368 TaxID=1882749 RepID=UPI00087A0867|nr:2Fe-2S iron-sulfur cluster-binding protein [Opitutus sp. GAS368]SDS14195.1 NADH-quinone oxidoreductase subunit G [Opitutus sp. GAS368]